MMQPDDLRPILFVGKMTAHGIADLLTQLLGSFALREYGRADRMRGQAAFGVLLDNEDDFGVHVIILSQLCIHRQALICRSLGW